MKSVIFGAARGAVATAAPRLHQSSGAGGWVFCFVFFVVVFFFFSLFLVEPSLFSRLASQVMAVCGSRESRKEGGGE